MSRRPKVRNVIAHVAVLALVAVTSTAAPQPQLPSAQEVIERHIEAVGGRAAIQGHSSMHMTGAVEFLGQGLVGTVSIYTAPDRTLASLIFADVGLESHVGYAAGVGWSKDSMTGERLLQGTELQQLVDDADFYADLHEASKFSSMEITEMVEFAGRASYKLELVYPSGREVLEYFDVESGRLAGVEGVQETIMGSLNVVTTVGAYEQFGDVMMPTIIVEELGAGQKVQTTVQSVEHDNVDPSVFELPAAIKALIG